MQATRRENWKVHLHAIPIRHSRKLLYVNAHVYTCGLYSVWHVHQVGMRVGGALFVHCHITCIVRTEEGSGPLDSVITLFIIIYKEELPANSLCWQPWLATTTCDFLSYRPTGLSNGDEPVQCFRSDSGR